MQMLSTDKPWTNEILVDQAEPNANVTQNWTFYSNDKDICEQFVSAV